MPGRLSSTTAHRSGLTPRTSAARRNTAGLGFHAINAVQTFADEFVDYPKAGKKIVDDLDTLLAFYDFPAEHWVHLRTTNPIESTFATVRHRTRTTRGAGARQAALAIGFKLMEAAQDRRRKISAPHHAQAVRNGTRFVNGKQQDNTRPGDTVAA